MEITRAAVTPLFSFPLIQYELVGDFEDLKEALKAESFRPNIKSEESSTEAGESLNVLDSCPQTSQVIYQCFKKANYDIYHCEHTEFKFTTSWFTRSKPETHSQLHTHRNSLISGVFYFDEYDENSGKIEFQKDFGISDIYVEPSHYNVYNANMWQVTPTKNMLIFFPSNLSHKVAINKSNKTRYSLAFNLLPVGNIGVGDSSANIELIPSLKLE